MDLHVELPPAIDASGLLALAEGHHGRTARALGVREAAGQLVKVYALEAPGRTVGPQAVDTALDLAEGHLSLGGVRGSLGLAVLIVHAGGDGDYILVHSWIEGHMSDLAVFTGPAGRPAELRPGRAGLAPCVWELVRTDHPAHPLSKTKADETTLPATTDNEANSGTARLRDKDAVVAEARRLGLAQVQWQTPAWNEEAVRFYDRLGARATEKLRYTLPVREAGA
ncbi:N-acetyltransferase family protein [Streptomyces sp. NPDC002076]